MLGSSSSYSLHRVMEVAGFSHLHPTEEVEEKKIFFFFLFIFFE